MHIKHATTRLIDLIARPSRSVTDEEERRHARLVATLLAVMLPLFIIPAAPRILSPRENMQSITLAFVLVVAYLLSRTRYHRWASALLLTAFTVVPFTSAVQRPDEYPPHLLGNLLLWTIPTLVLGALLERLRGAIGLFTLNMLLAAWLVAAREDVAWRHLAVFSGQVFVSATFLSISTFLWEREERTARRLSRAIEQSANAVVITDRQGTIEYVNPAFTRVSGYTAEEAIGRNPRILKSNHHPPEFYQEMWDTLLRGETWHGEFLNKRKNGELYWEDATITPIRDARGQTTHYIAIKTEITARKRLEAELEKQRYEREALYQAATALASTLDVDEVLQTIAKQVGETLDATSAYINIWDPKTKSSKVVVEYYGPEACDAERVSDLGAVFVEEDEEFIAQLERGEILLNHVDDPDIPPQDRAHMKQYGAKSVLYIPLRVRGRLVAFAEVWESRRRREFTPEEIALAGAISQQAGIAIEHARFTEQLRTQRDFLENIINAITSPFYVINADDYSIEIANQAAREMGIERASTCYAVTHRRESPCTGDEHPCPLVHVRESRQAYTVEHVHYRPDGTPYYVEVHGYPILDQNGNVVQMIEYTLDITARRAAEAELRKLHRAIEHTASGVVITDPEGVIEYVNPAFTHITGYTPEEAIGRNPRILKSGKHSREFYAELWNTIKGGKIWRGEMVNRRKNGELYWEMQIISPIVDERGEITHFVAVKTDVTERKRMEEQLKAAHDQALEANRLKTRLLANVSHDMRTPLGAIVGYAEMMSNGILGPLTDEQRRVTLNILDSSRQLLDFVNDLINQAELETGKIVITPRPFTPQELLEAVGTQVAFARQKGLTVTTEIAPDLPEKLLGDPYWLSQILRNLVSNAIKFTDQGSIHIALLRPDEQHWAIQVRDTGRGIAPEAQERIFEPFRQADETPTRRELTGSGLGLSIVAGLTELMQGAVKVDSTVGEGSTFTVTFPLRVPSHAGEAP